MSKANILLVEDERIASMDIQEMIEEAGYSVADATSNAESALEVLDSDPVDLVIMDINLPGEMDGIEATEKINEQYDIPVIYLTAFSNEETLDRARETEPAGYLVKPITQVDVKATIEMVLGDETE